MTSALTKCTVKDRLCDSFTLIFSLLIKICKPPLPNSKQIECSPSVKFITNLILNCIVLWLVPVFKI